MAQAAEVIAPILMRGRSYRRSPEWRRRLE